MPCSLAFMDYPLSQKETNMQIQLKQPEIEAAIRSYVRTLGFTSDVGKIAFTAGRGTSGVTADFDVGASISQADAVHVPAEKVRTARQIKADSLPEPANSTSPDADSETESGQSEDAGDSKKSLFA
jgi:hypothetical protein